jgi:hypothetical protein
MGANVQTNSTENKLYIGNRRYVSEHASQSKLKKARMLDFANWSPGLNVAWVEGGISAKAHFKIKLNQNDKHADIPAEVLEEFMAEPDYDAAKFLQTEDGRTYFVHGSQSQFWTPVR